MRQQEFRKNGKRKFYWRHRVGPKAGFQFLQEITEAGGGELKERPPSLLASAQRAVVKMRLCPAK